MIWLRVWSGSGNRFNGIQTLKFRAFWDVAPCSLIGVDRRFRGTYRLHYQGDNSLFITHRPDDGGETHLWNVGPLQWDYMALYPRKL
jgi:hypothetical protein